ncbi:MAG: efflux RND transporter permease subunit [Kofleriaceae bacterium]
MSAPRSSPGSGHFADRLAAWLDQARVGVLLLSIVVAVACAYVAKNLEVRSDLTNLLPRSQQSVKDLTSVRDRARPFGTLQIVVESKDAARVKLASEGLAKRFATFPSTLVSQLSIDDGPRQKFAWDNRFLFADLQDLVDARDALKKRLDDEKIRHNPLFIGLDDEDDPSGTPDTGATDRLDELDNKLAELERKATHPAPRVSADGTLRLLAIQTSFSASNAPKANALSSLVKRAIAEVRAELGGGGDLSFGLTGNITLAQHEHDSVLSGMTRSLLITVLLVGFALVVYYRSAGLVLAMLWGLAVAVLGTFAIAELVIGHLNVMTAFLFAIVIGNGINASLILVARFLEEIRAQGDVIDPRGAIAIAMREAIPGTLAAAATAAIAYASLLVTDFRGFRQFGMIGGVGMVLTWVTTFTVLPSILFVLARRGRIKRTTRPVLGDVLARLHPKNDRRALVVFAVVTAVSIAITSVYIARDPFTRDWRDLQSSTPEIDAATNLWAKMRAKLPSSSELTGQAYQLVFAVDKREDSAALVEYLRSVDKNTPGDTKWIRDVFSMDDLLPTRQVEKLAVLAEIRGMLDQPEVIEELSSDDRAKLAKLRPPDDLRAVTDADVPIELAWPFVERDGARGRLVVLRGAMRLDSFNVDHRREFAARTRALVFPVHAVVAGESLIVSDIIETMEADAPKMIVVALIGSVLAVFFVIGFRRHGLVTIACGLAGVIVMIAACAVAGLPAHFLDIIAVPITIGIGIDYAVNLAARDRLDGDRGPPYLLRTTGATVLLCSYTTAVGYGTLLLSANGGIRAFGLAALLGEITCVAVALIAAPAWLAVLRNRHRKP